MEKRSEMMKIHNDFLKICKLTASHVRSLKFKLRHKTKRYWKIGREIKNHPVLEMMTSFVNESRVVSKKAWKELEKYKTKGEFYGRGKR